MYIRRKMYSIGYDENDLYEVEQRAFSNGFACAERLFADSYEKFGENVDDENWLKRAWKYGFGGKAEQKARIATLQNYMDKKAGLKNDMTSEERKKLKKQLDAMLGEGRLTKEQEKLRKALMATKLGKAGIIGGGALGAGALGYGAYKASQD
jgi:hypothetical protein